MTHGLAGNITSFDSHWVLPTSLSLLHDGDFNLNEYKPWMEQVNYFATLCVTPDGKVSYLPDKPREVQRACQGEYQYYYPLAVPVLSAPVVWGMEKAVEAARTALTVKDEIGGELRPPRATVGALIAGNRFELERFAASVFVAMAAVLVYFLCREELPQKWSFALAMAYAFATPAWSIGSRGLWQHTLSMPLLAAALWIFSGAGKRPGLVPWAGLLLMTAFWVRPTNVLSLAVFSLYTLAFHRQRIVAYIAAMVPPFLLFGGINHSIYGSVLTPYSSAGRVTRQLWVHPQFVEALSANLISPGRGLFVFSPLFALAGFALRSAEEDRERRWLRLASMAVVLSHWIMMSSFIHWWGGHCFGPRFFTDLTPLFIFLLIPAVQKIREGSRPLATLGVILLLCSVFVHAQGALTRAAMDWNQKPVDIDRAPWRVWDWSHTSFLASFQRPVAEQKR